MGRAKHHQMEQEGKVDHALALCVQVGAAEECEFHPGTYLDSMEFFDYEELADKLVDKSPMSKTFFSGYKNSFEYLPDTRIPRVKKIKSGAL